MKIKELLKEKDEIEAVVEVYRKRISQLNSALIKFIERKKIHKPIKYLKKYAGEDIQRITLVSDSGNTYYYYGGEIMEIDENGNFYLSDYDQGIVEYQSNDGHYHSHYHYYQADLGKIVGIRNLVLSNGIEVKETTTTELLKKYENTEIIIKLVEEDKTGKLYG